MKKIKEYLIAGITILSIAFSPLISYAHSTPKLPKHKINSHPIIRTIDYERIYALPLKYNLDTPQIPRKLLQKSDQIERILSDERIIK